ncbi:hypothetical protein AVEN_177419-1 [Araneus ventricosus]|uniref:Uncharacterized protein n=1 Tax=Araneus ventricosus TaxID=182803 RepID=A0A4Y2IQ52_ARAVE|nr:hypothetical protein AVEN_177419-1 [Araneus ventricosus]
MLGDVQLHMWGLDAVEDSEVREEEGASTVVASSSEEPIKNSLNAFEKGKIFQDFPFSEIFQTPRVSALFLLFKTISASKMKDLPVLHTSKTAPVVFELDGDVSYEKSINLR